MHPPPFREAKNRDAWCQGEFKGNLSGIAKERTRRDEEKLELTRSGGSGLHLEPWQETGLVQRCQRVTN